MNICIIFITEKKQFSIFWMRVSPGEVIRDVNIHMTEELSHMDVENDFENCLKVYDKWYGKREDAYMANETGVSRAKEPYHFDVYAKDDGGYAGVALKYIRSKLSGKTVR